jgi:hypothetical protein
MSIKLGFLQKAYSELVQSKQNYLENLEKLKQRSI